MNSQLIQGVSFIVIARNEEFSLDKTLNAIASMPIRDCEVICVDSDSTDNTMKVMKNFAKRFNDCKILKCRGYLNAAVARNVGFEHAKKEYIAFYDGDVEPNGEFVKQAIDLIREKVADAVTGSLLEIIYSDGYVRQLENAKHPTLYYFKKKVIPFCGGCFVVSARVAREIGRFDECMVINEDYDYTLRISRNNRLLAIPTVMGTHHSLKYQERTLDFLKKKYPVNFGRLIRRNLDRPIGMWWLIRVNRGCFSGLLFIVVLGTLFYSSSYLPSTLVPIILFLALYIAIDLGIGVIKGQRMTNRFISHYIYFLYTILGIFGSNNSNQPTATEVDRVL
jgi:glycosyltransferase involved in cell wall biosynthesis